VTVEGAWDLRWTFGATAALRALPWRQGERVDAAVLRFARSGIGRVETVPGDPRALRLMVPPFVVRLDIDAEEGVLWVLAVFRGR
jgi:hypothetical protein